MNRIHFIFLIILGILLIVFNQPLGKMYLEGYNRTAKWLMGPLSRPEPHLIWIAAGIVSILLGLAGVVGLIW